MAQQQPPPPPNMLPRQGFLEKKGTLGMYSKKFCSFNPMTLEFVCSDKEGARDPIFASQLKQILVHDEDNQVLNFVGSKPGETISLKGQTYMIAGSWYNFVYSALEKRNIVRPRHGFLPKQDPRFSAPFLKTIPEEYVTRFTKLEHSVLYWFGEVKKYEAASLGKKPNLEDRVVFLSDKCLYVTTKTGQVTMCCKVHEIEMVFTNLTLKKAEGVKKIDHFIVLKFKNFDVHLQGHHLKNLVQVMSAIYNHHHGYKTLDIKESESALDGAVKLNINPDIKMAMVLPTPKHQLKKALDQFAAKHGITFEEDNGDEEGNNNGSGENNNSSSGASPSGIKAVTSSASPARSGSGNFNSSTDAQPGGNTTTEKELPYTDPLACFLANIELGKYYFKLVGQGVDMDCLEVMDSDDLKNFGIPEGAELNLLKYKLGKEDIVQEARDQAEQVQRGKKWLRSETANDDPNAPSLPASSQPSTVAASSPPPPKASTSGGGGGVLLDDSDEDDLLPRKPSLPPPAAKKSSSILFDSDSDDDLDLDDLILKPKAVGGGGASGGFKGKISLDSDSDDLGLGLSPKQSAANLKTSTGGASSPPQPKKSIDLLDDDDI